MKALPLVIFDMGVIFVMDHLQGLVSCFIPAYLNEDPERVSPGHEQCRSGAGKAKESVPVIAGKQGG